MSREELENYKNKLERDSYILEDKSIELEKNNKEDTLLDSLDDLSNLIDDQLILLDEILSSDVFDEKKLKELLNLQNKYLKYFE